MKKQQTKLVPRAFVEMRNSNKNNELWVIDEVRTSEVMAQREINIKENAIKTKRDSLTQGDLIEAIGSAIGNNNHNSKDTDSSSEIAELKRQLAESDKRNENLEKIQAAAKTVIDKKVDRIPVDDVQQEEVEDGNPNENWSLDELQKYCDANGIRYHHLSQPKKLLKSIELHNKSKS